MGVIDRIRRLISRPPEKRSLTMQSVFGQFGPMLSADVTSGEAVTNDSSMTLSAVWNAAYLISAVGIGTVPLKVYRDTAAGPVEARDHPLYRLLAVAPNPMMTAPVFRRTLQYHVLFHGNLYAEIEFNRRGDPIALWPMLPDRVEPFVNGQGKLQYRYTSGQRHAVLNSDEVFHVPGLGFDGLKGYSVLTYARQSMGLSIAADKFGGSFFGNGAHPSVILKYPGTLEDGGAKLRASWNGPNQGAANASRVHVLEDGVEATKISVNPDDAQFLETRKFTVEEVARWFNVPPYKLKDMGRATWANTEQMNIEFVTETLRPWFVLWEAEIDRKLISGRQAGNLYGQFVPEGLMRGDIGARYTAYSVGRQWGWLSVNDIREKEDMSKLPAEVGDVYLAPVNMVDAKNLSKLPGEPAPPDANVVAQVRALALTDLAKLVRVEAAEARKHGVGSARVSAWMQEFYTAAFEGRLVQSLRPIAMAVAAVRGHAPVDVGAVVRSLVSSSTSALLDLPGTGTEAAIRALADKWEATRPMEILQMLEVGE